MIKYLYSYNINMSSYLPPILHNGKLNNITNASDFNYQNNYISYSTADIRYVLYNTYTAAISAINSSITTINSSISSINTSISNIPYNDLYGNLIQNNKSITQTGTTNNNLNNTTISDLVVLNSIQFPNNVSIPQSTYTNSNITMSNGEIIQTDPSGNHQNQFIKSNFIGNISQTSGSNSLLDTTFTNIICSGDISCNTFHTPNVSNTQFNTLQGISTSSTIENRLTTINGNISSINTHLNNVDSSFNNVNTSINTINNTLTNMSYSGGTTTFNDNVNITGTLNGISNSIYGYLSGLSSNIQTTLTNLQSQINSNTSSVASLVYTTTNMGYNNSTNTTTFNDNVNITGNLNNISPAKLNYINNLSSDAQNQLTTLQAQTTNINYDSTNHATNITSQFIQLFGGTSSGLMSLSGRAGYGYITSNLFTQSLNFVNSYYENYSGGLSNSAFSFIKISDSSNNSNLIFNILNDGSISFTGSINGIANSTLQYIANLSSDAQTQLNSINSSISSINSNLVTLNYNTTNISYSSTYSEIDLNANVFIPSTKKLVIDNGLAYISNPANADYTFTYYQVSESTTYQKIGSITFQGHQYITQCNLNLTFDMHEYYYNFVSNHMEFGMYVGSATQATSTINTLSIKTMNGSTTLTENTYTYTSSNSISYYATYTGTSPYQGNTYTDLAFSNIPICNDYYQNNTTIDIYAKMTSSVINNTTITTSGNSVLADSSNNFLICSTFTPPTLSFIYGTRIGNNFTQGVLLTNIFNSNYSYINNIQSQNVITSNISNTNNLSSLNLTSANATINNLTISNPITNTYQYGYFKKVQSNLYLYNTYQHNFMTDGNGLYMAMLLPTSSTYYFNGDIDNFVYFQIFVTGLHLYVMNPQSANGILWVLEDGYYSSSQPNARLQMRCDHTFTGSFTNWDLFLWKIF